MMGSEKWKLFVLTTKYLDKNMCDKRERERESR